MLAQQDQMVFQVLVNTRSEERRQSKVLSTVSVRANVADRDLQKHQVQASTGFHQKFKTYPLTLSQVGKMSSNSSDNANDSFSIR